jgi:hypothetical protein
MNAAESTALGMTLTERGSMRPRRTVFSFDVWDTQMTSSTPARVNSRILLTWMLLGGGGGG